MVLGAYVIWFSVKCSRLLKQVYFLTVEKSLHSYQTKPRKSIEGGVRGMIMCKRTFLSLFMCKYVFIISKMKPYIFFYKKIF